MTRVRVVVVDFDGGDRTARCVRSVLATAGSATLDVVVVDNGSAVPVEKRLGELSESPHVTVVRSATNRGFAGGANLGIGDLAGVDAVALLNNDAVVPPSWLEPLVAALAADADLAAACPKIRFAGTYRRLVIDGDAPIRLYDIDAPARVTPDVPAPTGTGDERHRPLVAPSTFWVDSAPASVRIRVGAPRPTGVHITLGDNEVEVEAGPSARTVEIDAAGAPVALVNNVGTGWRADGYGYDIGYLEPDDGRFDDDHDVDAWCGGAALLRAEHLRDVGRFDERLFLYYEDLDLAWRGRGAGARFRLVPASVVDHDHSATAVSGSAFAEYYKERNRLLVVLRHRGWAAALRAAMEFVVATLGYVRRDVIAALVRGRRPSWSIVAYRVRALASALRLAPRFRPGSRPRA